MQRRRFAGLVRGAAFSRACHGAAAAGYVLMVATSAQAQVAQSPLYLGGGDVPGNLVLVPSVEYSTINSVANLGDYDERVGYVGYFDSAKCYAYNYSSAEADRHFYPIGFTSNHRCSNAWSGNYLNWAATQTIDPFRKALTGGYRVRDTASETWLEKARHDGQDGTTLYPNRRIPAGSGDNSALVSGATPASWGRIRTRIEGLGITMRFTALASSASDEPLNWTTDVVAYDPAQPLDASTVYEVSVRVKACVGALLEANCRSYSSAYKPEGLIQQYADKLRVGVFGYLNDPAGSDSEMRDGGVLRARQKFVGPTKIEPGEGATANPNVEWNSVTGVIFANPDPADAASTSVSNSGALNYLNKFGQLTTNTHKTANPVSELYYAALRYLRHQSNVAEYSRLSGTASTRARQTDGFPVITNWLAAGSDPIQYACQSNVILGIGDVYTERDKNLPGFGGHGSEPAMPDVVARDRSVNAVAATNKVGALEGLGNIGNSTDWTGGFNSAFIAGLAYVANASDLRTDLPGDQTVSTHWVDVLAAQTLEPPSRNQYYLAAKYGGLKIPDDADFPADPLRYSGSIPTDWWHTNGETLTSFGSRAPTPRQSFRRPDNYYVAGNAQQMVDNLTLAFARIVTDLRSSASSVTANSTRVDTQTAVIQAAFDSRAWSGELEAFRIRDDGTLESTAVWTAAAKLDALTDVGGRKIFTIAPPQSGSDVATTGTLFQWASLAGAQQEALRKTETDGALVSTTVGQDRLSYLRGVRTNEMPSGDFRARDSRLGDIVNSDPQFIHQQDFGYALLAQSTAFGSSSIGQAYQTFRNSTAYRSRTPLVVVGANDGMLHGFDATIDASGGAELFAYVPNAVYEHLYELTLPSYEHRYYVDGSARVADAYLDGLGWRTIVVGATGAGGKSVFALDVTNPSSMTASSVLWEFSPPQMGYTRGQPAVAPLPNGKFGVIVTSGYEANDDQGHIWILDPRSGSIIHTIDVPTTGGLGPALVSDLNGDRVADRIYVGDTDGKLWRFDLADSSTSSWGAPASLAAGGVAQPLFIATDGAGESQAITGPLASAFNQNGAHMVFFGTGSFHRIGDNEVDDDTIVDSFYGIVDRGVQIAGRNDLLGQQIIAETAVGGTRVRGVTAHQMTAAQAGWYVDLLSPVAGVQGERVVSRPVVRGDRVIFATLIPNPDPCEFGGDSWVMELSTFNGGRLGYTVFDLNIDGDFDGEDFIAVTVDGERVALPASGIDPDVGITQTPTVVTVDDGEIKVLSGSSGNLVRISERGSVNVGRQSWRELR